MSIKNKNNCHIKTILWKIVNLISTQFNYTKKTSKFYLNNNRKNIFII